MPRFRTLRCEPHDIASTRTGRESSSAEDVTRWSRVWPKKTPDPVGRVTLVLVACVVQGCAPPAPTTRESAPVDPQACAERRAAVYRRTEQRLPTAALLKPSSNHQVERGLLYMAPLIMQGPVDPGAHPLTFERFGAVSVDDRGIPRVETDRLTVYFFDSEAHVQDRAHAQWNYVWFYPPQSGRDAAIRWRGIRMTLDGDGFPVIWEPSGPDQDLRVVFVSSALARAAGKEHGLPPTGRRYPIERPLAQQPTVVVAGLLGDAPQPMGPYVYLLGDLQVSTLLCRCSTALVDRWFTEQDYDLVRIRDVRELRLETHVPEDLGLSPDLAWLEEALRLPAEWPSLK